MGLDEISLGVVIPNKNDSKFLEDCLESVLHQSSLPDEIIFIDDGSSDNSVEIAEKYLTLMPDCLIIKNKTSKGTMAVLNQGLMISNSDYLLFLSSNDCLLQGIFSEVRDNIKMLEKRPGVWSALVKFLDENGIPKRSHYSPLLSFSVEYFNKYQCINFANKLGNWFTGTTTFYDRENLKKIGGFDPNIGGLGDLFAALQLSSLNGAIFCPKPYGYMRTHREGLLNKTLGNPSEVDFFINAIIDKGKKNAPLLFNPEFVKKTIARIRFASIHVMLKSQKKFRIASNWDYIGIKIIKYLHNKINRKILILFSYLIIRPFDLTFAVYYRTKAIFRGIRS
jgi:glycosyltransferase involved in cell wall biosynthesis